MHNAPSVVFPVGRSAFQGGLSVALGVLSAVVGALFLVTSDSQALGVPTWLPWFASMVGWLGWATWAGLSWFRSPWGSLRWEPRRVEEDGAVGVWSWTDGAGSEPLVLSRVERVLDLQGCVLLCFRGPGVRQRWAWVERSSAPAYWSDLRRALLAGRA